MSKKVAFISFGIGDITGGGGAERFFADFFDYYSSIQTTKFKLFWLIDKDSKAELKKVNKLKTNIRQTKLIIFSNRFKIFIENMQILFFIITRRIDIVHIPWYNVYYIPTLQFIQKLPAIIRPKLSINIVDCNIPYCYYDKEMPRHKDIKKSYEPLFSEINVNGYFAWNSSFVDFMKANKLWVNKPVLDSITSRFCDTAMFFPQYPKENTVVFASRLVNIKRPDWFLQAIHLLNTEHKSSIAKWKFLICGDGPEKKELINFVKEKELQALVTFVVESNMQNILNVSKCFVSCQDFDNFPSMSMAEAMAAGNVIVSRNVGQTGLFVEDKRNGFLATEDSPNGIALALLDFFENQDRFDEMSEHSVRMMKEIHTPENFVPQIEAYWTELLNTNG